MRIVDATGTVGALWRRIALRLRNNAAGGRDSDASLDARLLVAHAAGIEPPRLPLAGDRPVSPEVDALALSLAERRIAGEPVARITGTKEFWSLDFALSPQTLVPRPDTETLVEGALRHVERRGARDAPLRILDLGTGTGAILIALLSELPQASGVGIDLAEGAAATARGNALRHGLAGRAAFAVGNWAAAIGGRFDLVVANPPYVTRAEMRGLPIEVREHDPRLALDGGPDGLAAYRTILAGVTRLLTPGGAVFLEVGMGQAASVGELAAEQGLATGVLPDIAGIERVVSAEWREP